MNTSCFSVKIDFLKPTSPLKHCFHSKILLKLRLLSNNARLRTSKDVTSGDDCISSY